MPKTLSEFLIYLAYNVDELESFLGAERSSYIEGADLSPSDKTLLLSGDANAINQALAAEAVDTVMRDDGGGHIKLIKKSDAGA